MTFTRSGSLVEPSGRALSGWDPVRMGRPHKAPGSRFHQMAIQALVGAPWTTVTFAPPGSSHAREAYGASKERNSAPWKRTTPGSLWR